MSSMGTNLTGKSIIIQQPRRLVFGNGCVSQFVTDFAATGLRRPLIITTPPVLPLVKPLIDSLRKSGMSVSVWDGIVREPDVKMFDDARKTAQAAQVDAVIGIGGGSSMDTAKLVAAMHDSDEGIQDVLGIGNLPGRNTYLACLPTTSGTGSEVSPNAIIFDDATQMKKGVISPYLVPDASYVDPLLTRTVPADVTAATGMDALTHCIEEYANRFAHPIIDLYALQGIRLIGDNLKLAYENGGDVEARAKMSLGSMYGGLGIGNVGVGAVHALAYPLGGEFHVSHGVSNSLMLPHVLEFNTPAAPDRYAQVALALGVKPASSDLETAERGLERIRELSHECGIPATLSELGVPREALERMAESAMTVTRLLKNNPRELEYSDAMEIYRGAY